MCYDSRFYFVRRVVTLLQGCHDPPTPLVLCLFAIVLNLDVIPAQIDFAQFISIAIDANSPIFLSEYFILIQK